jgi:hypothetical protein
MVADLLRVLAVRDDILMANFWSLTGNWLFGTVSNGRQLRPAYQVLAAYAKILRGRQLTLEVRQRSMRRRSARLRPPSVCPSSQLWRRQKLDASVCSLSIRALMRLRWRDIPIKLESVPLRLPVGLNSLLWVEINQG